MSFYGSYFSFDGEPCTEFNLMIYEFSATGLNKSNTIIGKTNIVEDRLVRRYTPLHYGSYYNSALEFTMSFGLACDTISTGLHLDNYDKEAIAMWLTGHQEYKYLEIEQPDLEQVRYKCIISNLQYTSIGNMGWGFTCTVKCDSPYAYCLPETQTVSRSSSTTNTLQVYNRSSLQTYYKPKMSITSTSGGNFTITNTTDNNRQMIFTSIPTGTQNITIDNENCILTMVGFSNPYPYFNMNFFRLKRGNNTITISGTGRGTITFDYEFPVLIGG